MMRPLDPLRSVKLKLGAVIVATVAVTVVAIIAGARAGIATHFTVPGAMALGLVMIQLLARGMTSPLREMASAARSMASGEYGRRVTATSRDEVGELARAFNAMAAELAETDRFRRDLVANVSHELRTPITALRAQLENLIDGVDPPDPAVLDAMLSQVERLGRLVTQLLDLSRLEAGTMPFERSAFDVEPVIAQAVREAALHAPTARVDVDVDTGLRADGDAERVHQVVANLLENALRHSPAEAPVVVRATTTDRDQVVIEVSDRGPGIAAEDRSRVFERFYRADFSRASARGGAGLGLAIAKWIVDLHGGDIRAEPNNPNGCRMVVVLPGANQ